MQWPPEVQSTARKTDAIYLSRAYRYGWKHSTDNSTKNGALIIQPRTNKVLGYGSNHLPAGAPKPRNKQEKYELTVHAEEDAINKAPDELLAGSRMYMPWLPCVPCAQEIIESGIQELVGHKQMVARTPKRWRADLETAVALLDEARIDIKLYDGNISDGDIRSLLDRKVWYP